MATQKLSSHEARVTSRLSETLLGSAGGQSSEMPAVTTVAVGFSAF